MLREKLLDPRQSVRLYGTTPPRAGTSDELIEQAVTKLAARLEPHAVDAVVVYDIQDETGRTSAPRPFPFVGTVDPRRYARLLEARTRRPAIVYKSLGQMDERAWRLWLDETAEDYGARFLSVVGRPTSGVKHAMKLSRAIRLAAEHPANFCVGGVVIAERHNDARSESARILAKSVEGCSYFISQTVYAPEATIRLLRDYARDCRGAGVEPRRIVLTFAPVGREKTLAFMKWLGVSLPEATVAAILGAPDPLMKSLEICGENLGRVLSECPAGEIPIGVNVESVSINRDEIDASVELLRSLTKSLPAT